MKVTRGRVIGHLLILGGLLIAALALSLSLGVFDLDFVRALEGGPGNPHRDVLETRLVRSLLAIFVGGVLSLVGTLFQAMTRNPLADPFILGVSGGAAVGATLAIVCGVSSLVLFGIHFPMAPPAAFLGALLALAFVVRLSKLGRGLSVYRLLLVGVVLNFFASAVVMLMKTLAGAVEVRALLLWLVGSLGQGSFEEIVMLATVAIVGVVLSTRKALALNIISVGDSGASLLGVDVERLRRRLFILSSLMVGAAVSVSGLIGFVGLVVPHGLRQIYGSDHRLLVPASFLGGALFLLASDGIARALFPVLGSYAPVGVITAFVGGPVFLFLLLREEKKRGELGL